MWSAACSTEGPDVAEPSASLSTAPATTGAAAELAATELPSAEEGADAGPGEIVYERRSTRVSAEADAVEQEQGTLDTALWRLAARPEDGLREGILYNEEAWFSADPEGATESGYRIRAAPVTAMDPFAHVTDPACSTADLASALAKVGPKAPVRIMVRLAGWRPGPLPLIPTEQALSQAEVDAATDERTAATAERRATFEIRSAPVRAAIAALGGKSAFGSAATGWFAATIPADALASLGKRDDVACIVEDHQYVAGGHTIEQLRGRSYTDSITLSNAGYWGTGDGTPAKIAVLEPGRFEDEACMFDTLGPPPLGITGQDACDPGERVKGKFDCSDSACTAVTNYADDRDDDMNQQDDSFHGTVVSSLILGDYSQGQAEGVAEFSGLPAGWQTNTRSWAKEAYLYYFSALINGSFTSAFQQAVLCAEGGAPCTSAAEILNLSSQRWGSGCTCSACCDETSSSALEDELENFADAGGLPVVIAGNKGDIVSTSSCSVTEPGDTPKVLTVAGTDATASAYDTWGRLSAPSAGACGENIVSGRGGADVKIRTSMSTGSLSIVDLAAPGTGVWYDTDSEGTYGRVLPTGNYVGTSFAAPIVAGAAAQVKDWFLDKGQTWIANPARLHTVMLLMGDRATWSASYPGCVSGSKLLCGADHVFGLGRLKLRYLEPGSPSAPYVFHYWTYTHTTSTPDPAKLGAFEAPAGAKMVKCVAQQWEDMSSKDNISKIGLRVRVRTKPMGGCAVDQGTQTFSRYDGLPDDKHMVAILDSEVNIENQCIQVEADRETLSTFDWVTTIVACYASDEFDYEPL